MIFALLQLVALASASRMSMMGHHHHHHHHHGAHPSDSNGPGTDKMSDKEFMDKMKNGKLDLGEITSGISPDMNDPSKPIDTKSLPPALQGLAKAANSGDSDSIMASIQSMTGMSLGGKKDSEMHIRDENGESVYDLRGAFKTQTAAPLKLPTMPPPPDMSKKALKKYREARTSTTTTTTTTSTSTTTTTTTTMAKIVPPAAVPQAMAQPMLASAVQAKGQPFVAQPFSQPAGQSQAPQGAMQFLPQQVQQFQQFPQMPVQQFQQFPQQNAFLPPQQVQQMPAQMQAIENGLGQMMQTMGAMNNQAAGAARAEMDAQRVQGEEQMDHNALEQLTQRVVALETSKSSTSSRSEDDFQKLQKQLRAQTTQMQAQGVTIKDEQAKIQELTKRLEVQEQAKSQNDDNKEAAMLRRLDALEKEVNSTKTQESASSAAEVELKNVKTQLASVQAKLDAQTKTNAAMHAELQKLEGFELHKLPTNMALEDKDEEGLQQNKQTAPAAPRPPPSALPPPPGPPGTSKILDPNDFETDLLKHAPEADERPTKESDEDDSDSDADDASLLQFGHRQRVREEPIHTEFHRKIRHGSYLLQPHKA